jgi:hypothetical protein
VRDSESGRRIAVLIVLAALVVFALLWLTVDANTFSSVHGAP